jgi:multiple sugar transport system ATP-binding protein
MAAITLEKLTKVYGDGTRAVSELDLEIEDGEFVVLVGPSGCGKTSALRMVAGLEPITEGRVLIGGEVVNKLPPKDRDIAMIFQNYALYPHMSAFDNMAFGLKLRGMKRERRGERVKSAARTLGLGGVLPKKPRTLSGGQRQRVAMGRAIVREPRAFLMDEPLSNLDAKLRVEMRAEIARMQRELDVTTIYVTHDQVEAMTLGDRVAVMRAGEIQQVGPPEELYDRPTNLFVAGFIGSPAMNFLPATVSDGVVHSPLGDLRLPEARRQGVSAAAGDAERTFIIGIRPEHFEDAGLVGYKRDRGAFVSAKVYLLESLGSDKYAYFTVQGQRATAAHLEELAADAGLPEMGAEEGVQITARLDAASQAKEDEELDFWLDLDKVQVFDPESGANLTLTKAASES